MPDLDILVILDRSGSMQDGRADHEGGLKSFVEDQRKLPGDVRFTLVQFDTQEPCEIVYDRVPLADVKDIQLIPRGGTPLSIAVGRALAHLEQKQQADPPTQGTIVMVITDGEETDYSPEWNKTTVKARIAELEKRKYSFLYLGADVDAFAEAAAIGVPMAAAMPFQKSHKGMAAAYGATGQNIGLMRSAMASGGTFTMASQNLNYSAAQIAAANEADDEVVSVSSNGFFTVPDLSSGAQTVTKKIGVDADKE